MKTKLLLTLVGVAFATVYLVIVLTKPRNEKEAKFRRAKVESVSVYFNPKPDGQKWVDKKLSNIIPVGKISKLILIESGTSAPPILNSATVYRILEDDAVFYRLEGKYPVINISYKAIVVSKDNHVFQIEVGIDADGNRLARLSSEEGIYGYFLYK